MTDLYSLNNTTKEILAFATKEVFSNAEYLQGEASEIGFFYDFYFPYPICEEFLSLVEEKMRGILDKKGQIEHKEMLFSNAISYLEHLGQVKKAETLEFEKDQLIDLFIMDGQVDLCNMPFLTDCNKIKFFKLYSAYFLEKDHIRVHGIASFDKEALKDQLKMVKNYEKQNHIALGEKNNLFLRSGADLIWLNQGIILKDKLYEFWKSLIAKQNFELIELPEDISIVQYVMEKKLAQALFAEKLLKENVGFTEGLFHSYIYKALKEYIFCSEEKLLHYCISSLQFFLKIIKIFDFTYEVVLLGKEKNSLGLKRALDECGIRYRFENSNELAILFKIADNLNRKWAFSYLELKTPLLDKKKLFYSKEQVYIERSSLGSIERCLALLIEKAGGDENIIFEKLNRSDLILEN